MPSPEDLSKRNTPGGLAEKINSAVRSAYELNKDKIEKLHDALLSDAEIKLAELRKLPPETKIRCRTDYRDDPPAWEVVSLDEFITLIEKRKAKISIEEYLKFVTEGLTDILANEPDWLEKYQEHLIRDQYNYDGYAFYHKDSGSIVPEYTIEGRGLSKLKDNPFPDFSGVERELGVKINKPIIDI